MSDFLSLSEQIHIDNLFRYKTKKKWKKDGGQVKQKSKKCLIPIGVQELVFKNYEWTGTSTTGELMLHIQIWKPPVDDGHRTKISFDYIDIRHLIALNKRYKLADKWFYPIGRNYTEEQLNLLISRKGKKFKAIVKHKEETFNKDGKSIPFTRAEIVRVVDKDIDETSINYIELYERLKT